jgi:16S rRNA (guanine527-N7)-methyltransferase
VLERARALGFLGPPPPAAHISHADAFARAAAVSADVRALDLGSGGGVPGLVLAVRWPRSVWTLLDSGERRTAFLAEAVAILGLVGRVAVVRARAEAIGRDPTHRGRYDLVTARAFGPPAVTAECAAPLLRTGGRLLVSEPPDPEAPRWPSEGLAQLGLRALPAAPATPTIQVLELVEPCPERFPRRVGVPAKRLLW